MADEKKPVAPVKSKAKVAEPVSKEAVTLNSGSVYVPS